MEEVITVIFTEADVRSMAEEAGIDLSTAMDRARSWGKHIADTISGIASEQLASCIANDTP